MEEGFSHRDRDQFLKSLKSTPLPSALDEYSRDPPGVVYVSVYVSSTCRGRLAGNSHFALGLIRVNKLSGKHCSSGNTMNGIFV